MPFQLDVLSQHGKIVCVSAGLGVYIPGTLQGACCSKNTENVVFDASRKSDLIRVAPIRGSGEDKDMSSMGFVNGGTEWFGTSCEACRYADNINTLRNKPSNSLGWRVSYSVLVYMVVEEQLGENTTSAIM